MKKLKTLFKNYLAKNSLIVFSGGALAGFFNYLYHVICGRLLTPEHYGLLQSFISLSYFLAVLSAGFSYAIINSTVSLAEKHIWPMVKKIEITFGKISLLLLLFFFSLSPFIKNFLHLKQNSALIVFAFFAASFLFPIIYQSLLQARLRFLPFSLLAILTSLTKLIFAWLFLFLGWQIFGALGGLVASNLAIIVVGRVWIIKNWRQSSKPFPKLSLNHQFWSYSLLSLFTNLALISLYSTDILLVRHYFTSYQSGIYAAASVLGRIIFFTSSAILLVSFPLFVRHKTNGVKLRQIFWFSFLFISLVCLVGLVLYQTFPDLIVKLLYNKGFSQTSLLLPVFAIYVILLTIFNLCLQLLLALGKRLAVWMSSLVASLQIFLILNQHATLKIVVNHSIFSLGLGLALGLFFVNKAIDEVKN